MNGTEKGFVVKNVRKLTEKGSRREENVIESYYDNCFFSFFIFS